MNTARIFYVLISTTGAALALHDNAVARDGDAPPQRVVSYADLNLNDPAGVSALFDRLAHAAKTVCPAMPSPPHLALRNKARKCAAAALRDAVATVGNDNLTAYYNDRTIGSSEAGKLAARR